MAYTYYTQFNSPNYTAGRGGKSHKWDRNPLVGRSRHPYQLGDDMTSDELSALMEQMDNPDHDPDDVTSVEEITYE